MHKKTLIQDNNLSHQLILFKLKPNIFEKIKINKNELFSFISYENAIYTQHFTNLTKENYILVKKNLVTGLKNNLLEYKIVDDCDRALNDEFFGIEVTNKNNNYLKSYIESHNLLLPGLILSNDGNIFLKNDLVIIEKNSFKN